MKNEKRYVTMSDTVATAAGILAVPFCLFFSILATKIYGLDFWRGHDNMSTLIVCGLALISFIPHELIHAAGWMICGKSWSDMHFGLRLPICAYIRFDGTMSRKTFAIGCAAPFIVLSVLPMAVGSICGNFPVFCFGLLQSMACGSDLLSCIRAMKLHKDDVIADEEGITGFVVVKTA